MTAAQSRTHADCWSLAFTDDFSFAASAAWKGPTSFCVKPGGART